MTKHPFNIRETKVLISALSSYINTGNQVINTLPASDKKKLDLAILLQDRLYNDPDYSNEMLKDLQFCHEKDGFSVKV
jgi:hypothetical protein